ncbi:INTS6 [Lepeophtheirus salmonis]|uniref:INTS6 n=1 Tax=Lepeophtheirus salmonis TaxID=72036 RepID=A0A7R8H3Q8_LEPSM|nr:INTS6 [Lepeophtheirus salmonis]CAF2849166.1 INTS6 [Lepeophtheirus salmonis]
MEQKAYASGRCSLLDVAKGAVEFFVKMRQKFPESRGDRYMLLTFEDYPRNIKAGWKENFQTFMNELKNLVGSGMTTMGSALKQVFDILNMNRMQTGIDMYGQGRYPFYLEPVVIIVISDGGKLTTQDTVEAELNLPMHSTVPGSELTPSQDGHVATDKSPIDAMCEVTGGRSYVWLSISKKWGPDPPILNKHPDNDDSVQIADEDTLNAKVLTFSNENNCNIMPHTPNPILSPSNINWHNCRRLIYVPKSTQKGFTLGFLAVFPESFLPDIARNP